MSCINPITIRYKRHNSYIVDTTSVPCGHCLDCMIKKQSQLEFLCKKELLTQYQKGFGASFVTLTYDNKHIPQTEEGFMTLQRSDVQKFIKNMRRQMEYYNVKKDFKYVYCGEYGDSFGRPHYHIVFFGLCDTEVAYYTRKLWKHGVCDIGPLGQGGIRYVLKYMQKSLNDKVIRLNNDELGIENPFIYHSLGMGKSWIINNLWKIVENGFTFNIAGKKMLFPRHVMRFVSFHTGVDYLPYVKKFLTDEMLPKVKGLGYTSKEFESWQMEESILRYKNNIAALRSKGIPVDDLTTNKKWIRPMSYHDRQPTPEYITKMVNEAFNVS